MLPDRVSNPGPLTYESGALPIALRGPAAENRTNGKGLLQSHLWCPIDLLWLWDRIEKQKYSRPSVARRLMARLSRLFRTLS